MDRAYYSTPAVWYGPALLAGSVHLEIIDDHQTIVPVSPSDLGHIHMARVLVLEEEEDPSPCP